MTTPELVQAQRTYFETGATRSADFRLAALKKLQAAVQANERALAEAMAAAGFRRNPPPLMNRRSKKARIDPLGEA